jgi:2-polyprenyl-3-methyl-5-hydroxy-6-metoxy-1,4-benzoquinol methylase/uncharacterized protein YbaR (Trm112 family)
VVCDRALNLSPSALALFSCPKCTADLTADAEGTSVDCHACGASFPVVAGIPRFVSSEGEAASFGLQWNLHRETQLDSFTGVPASRHRLFAATAWPERLDGERILEAGSGAGRFTQVLLSTGAFVWSFDRSTAVEANAATNGRSDRLCLFQGDLFRTPLKKQAFDRVLCLGVLQHTPDPARAFQSLTAHVRPGGSLVVDLYAKRLTALLSWKYLLRPITKRMDRPRLYRLVERSVDLLLPLAVRLRRIGGRAAVRLLPITEYSHLGFTAAVNRQWAILDTFDMYSPAHDHPQTPATLRRWFAEAGFTDIDVGRGPNGIVGRGRRP